jgi:hypothetical protein
VVPNAAYFGITQNGSYKCNVTTYAFGTNAVSMQLYNNSTATILGTANSSASNFAWVYATVVLETTFNITAATVATPQQIQVRQGCQSLPSSNANFPAYVPADINSCALGFSSGSYSAASSYKAVINCVLVTE